MGIPFYLDISLNFHRFFAEDYKYGEGTSKPPCRAIER